MLIPMKPIRTVAVVMRMRPPMAEVIISLALLTLSGTPPDMARVRKP